VTPDGRLAAARAERAYGAPAVLAGRCPDGHRIVTAYAVAGGWLVSWEPPSAVRAGRLAVADALLTETGPGDVLDCWCARCRRPWSVPARLLLDAARRGVRVVTIRLISSPSDDRTTAA
jgi:hypothetical protein